MIAVDTWIEVLGGCMDAVLERTWGSWIGQPALIP
jgi:hypothetical protein